MEWTQGYVESSAALRRASQEIVGITLAEVGQPVTVQQLELLRHGVEAQSRWALVHGGDRELIDLLRDQSDRLCDDEQIACRATLELSALVGLRDGDDVAIEPLARIPLVNHQDNRARSHALSPSPAIHSFAATSEGNPVMCSTCFARSPVRCKTIAAIQSLDADVIYPQRFHGKGVC
jgi:hypothetical protein